MQIKKNRLFSIVLESIQSIEPTLLSLGYFLPTAVMNILSLGTPIVILQIYDRIIPNQSFHTLKILIIGAVAVVIFELFFKILRARIALWQAACFEYDANYNLFKQLLELPINKLSIYSSGQLVNQFNMIKSQKDLLGGGKLLMTLIDLPFVAIYLIFILVIGHYLVLVPIAAIVAMIMLVLNLTKDSQQLSEEKNQLDNRKFNLINEIFNGLHTIKTHSMEALMLRRYECLQTQHSNWVYKSLQHQFQLHDWHRLLNQLTLVFIVTLGAMGIIHGEMTLGAVAACMLLSSRTMQPIAKLAQIYDQVQKILMIQNSNTLDIRCKVNSDSSLDKTNITRVQGQIEFKNITVGYKENILFENLDWLIQPGALIYLSGLGASGKTTLLQLIITESMPMQGKVLIDGKQIVEHTDYLKQICYIGPDTTLFQGSILENLNGFDNTNKIENINELLTDLGLNAFIQKLPKGLHTVLSNQSADLIPKGVKQRLILIRTILQNPAIILFDEANINLDSTADEFITKFFEKLRGKITTIIVSHRPSLKKIASKAYTIHKKKVVIDE